MENVCVCVFVSMCCWEIQLENKISNQETPQRELRQKAFVFFSKHYTWMQCIPQAFH